MEHILRYKQDRETRLKLFREFGKFRDTPWLFYEYLDDTHFSSHSLRFITLNHKRKLNSFSLLIFILCPIFYLSYGQCQPKLILRDKDKGTFRFIKDVTNKYNEHQLIRITRKPYNGKSEF